MSAIFNLVEKLSADVFSKLVFPLLSVRDLQSLDTAYTNKDLRPHLRRLWTLYNYEFMEEVVENDECSWLCDVRVQITALTIRTFSNKLFVFPSLKRLCCKEYISDNLLMQLAEACPELEEINVKCELSNFETCLRPLAEYCHHLHKLTLIGGGKKGSPACQFLCNVHECFPHLRHIHFDYLSDASLISIASNYPHLQSISIRGNDVTDAGLLEIADKCRELALVTVNYCPNITSSGLAALWEHCPQLTALNICVCKKLSDDALIALGQHCSRLKLIDISGIGNISDMGISALATGCPLLQEFIAVQTNITDAGIIALTCGCRDLRKIDTRHCKSIGINAISAIAERCALMSELSLNVDDNFVTIITRCRNLTKLHLHTSHILCSHSLRTVAVSCRMLKEMSCSCRQYKVVFEWAGGRRKLHVTDFKKKRGTFKK